MTVKVILSGGLGNQLFQFAAGRSLAIAKGTDLVVDPMWCAPNHGARLRRFELFNFPIRAKMIRYSSGFNHRDSLHWRVRRRLLDFNKKRFTFTDHFYNPEFWDNPKNVKIYGYFSSYRYFESYYPIFSDELDISETVWSSLDDERKHLIKGRIAVHIRRGDFLQIDGFEMRDAELYYRNALRTVRERTGLRDVLVFSDDVPWCAKQSIFAGAAFWAPNFEQPHLDMFAMSQCDAIIIANSTFSWWSAWFASQQGKVVVAPRMWSKGLISEEVGLIPPNWLCQ